MLAGALPRVQALWDCWVLSEGPREPLSVILFMFQPMGHPLARVKLLSKAPPTYRKKLTVAAKAQRAPKSDDLVPMGRPTIECLQE